MIEYKRIAYFFGKKFELVSDYERRILFVDFPEIETNEIGIVQTWECEIGDRSYYKTSTVIYIKKGFKWDGMTGWFTTKKNIEPSLVHDALYTLMEKGLLDLKYKDQVDDEFYDHLRRNDNDPVLTKIIRWVVGLKKVKIL